MNNFFNYKTIYKTEDSIFIFVSTWMYTPNTFNKVEKAIKEIAQRYKNIHAFLIPWWYRDGIDHYNLLKKYCKTVTILANTLQDNIFYSFNGLTSLYCNQNCWIDSNIFKIQEIQKEYDLVINANNQPWKNHSLIADINYTKLFITYDATDRDLRIYNPSKIYKNLLPTNVAQALNQAKIGLALSEKEGSCYASTEYLLCGLPVVSIKSKGGRHVWYNNKNSIIFQNSKQTHQAIRALMDRITEYDSQVIRKDCINQQNLFREKFYSYFQKKYGISNIKHIIESNFTTRMLHYFDLDNVSIENIIDK